MIKKYTKLPVEIEACQLTWATWNEICEFMEGEVVQGCYLDSEGNKLPEGHTSEIMGMEIGTIEGVMLARQGDYIIKGVNGEFYPCKEDIFLKTYKESY